MQHEASVEIDRPVDEVFHLTNDHVAEWSIIVVEDEMLEKTPQGVGSTFRTVTQEGNRRMEFQGEVTRYDPPRASAVHMTGTMFDIDAEYTFEDLGGRTRVTQKSSVTGKGWIKLMFALCGWMMNKSSCQAQQKELASLKSFCEQHADAAAG